MSGNGFAERCNTDSKAFTISDTNSIDDLDVQRDKSDQDLPVAGRRHRHREMLFISVVVVCLSFLLKVRPDQTVEFVFLPGWASPETCLSRGLWGVSCPGCGITRSFVYLAQGSLAKSIAVNRVGWLLAIATIVQIPYRSFLLHWLSKHGLPEPVPPMFNLLFSWTLIVALIGNWVLLMAGI
ncbi:MAG: DUF2752 domain-containing protein [Planctomycetaceae bacterium]